MHAFPLHFCPVRKQYIELDQTRLECATEHGCALDKCPVPDRFFAVPESHPVSTQGEGSPATAEKNRPSRVK